jgi:disulfide bond formation protein DsbB
MQSERVVRCDEAAWRFLGLSLAGYNVLISLALAAIAAWGFLGAYRSKPTEAEAPVR